MVLVPFKYDTNFLKTVKTYAIPVKLVFWCPITIELNGADVWSNKLPNSTMYSHPLCLMREKENRESVLKHFKPYIDSAHEMETF